MAYLELSGKVTAGEYSVTVTGLTEEALTGSFTSENETVAKVKVLTTEAPLIAGDNDKDNQIKVAYQLLNQYGEDVTKSVLGANLLVTPSKGEAGVIASGDRGTVTLTGDFKADDQVTVVIVDQNTGKSATGVVTVVKSAVLDTVELGDVYNAKGLELSEDNAIGQFVLISGFDQYGNEVEFTGDDVTIVSSNKEVAEFTVSTVEIDDKNVPALAINVRGAGTTTLTVVSNFSGKSATKEITIAAGVKTDTIVIGDPEGTVSGNKDILLPVEIVNNKGELITEVSDAKVEVTGTNITDTDGKATIVKKDGVLFVKFTTATVAEDETETVVLTAKTETGNVVTKVLTVKPDAVATELVGIDKSVSLNIVAGHTLEIPLSKFIVNDQYGDRITDATKYNIEVDFVADSSTFKATVDNSKVTISPIVDVDPKTETVIFKLKDVVPESSIEQKITVVTASEFVSYEVEDVKVIYAAKDDNGVWTVADGYDQDIVVKATTDTGKVVTLGKNDYTVVGKPTIGEEVEFAKDATEAKVTVTITINATGEVLTKELTYSNVVPKVVDFIFTSEIPSDLAKAVYCIIK